MPKETRTYKQRAEYLIDAVKKRRKALRTKAIIKMGGKCSVHGYDKCFDALEFHHLNPKNKSFNISVRGLTRSWEKVESEISKCTLICANCHREIHAKSK